MEYTDAQIYENRKTWIEFLKRSDTQKGRCRLDNGNGERCCLGHGCHILNIEKFVHGNSIMYGSIQKENGAAPQELIEMVGLHNKFGADSEWRYELENNNNKSIKNTYSLADLNDSTEITPQEIGEYLESVILGGPDTPFKEIKIETDL